MKNMEALLETLQSQLQKSLDGVRAEAKRLSDAADAAMGGKIAAFKPCEVPAQVGHGIQSFGSSSSWIRTSWEVCARNAREVLDKARASLEAQHAANLPLIENNKRVAAQVKLIMNSLGVPDSRTTYRYATPRARKATPSTVTAGYLSDLAAVCPTSDNYDGCKRQLDEFERRIEAFENAEKAKAAEEARQQEQARAARAKLTLLGAMAQKYGCEPDFDDIIDAMGQRSKYFRLGYWLERNRINWNDGPSHAERGLDGFTVETEDDAQVEADVRARIEDWDGDGRCFRDSPYGYGYCYGQVDEDIMRDFDKLRQADLMPCDP